MALRLSLSANVVLLFALGIMTLLFLRENFRYELCLADRPQGNLVTLPESMTVYSRADGQPAFTLPQGTVLQESTPHPLGKSDTKEYLVIIRSSQPATATDSLDTSKGWMDHYRFEIPLPELH